MSQSLYIAQIGAATPFGTRIGMSAGMYHSGISRYAAHPYKLDRKHEHLPFCHAQYLQPDAMIAERMAFLAMRALKELPKLENIPVRIALPEHREGLIFEHDLDKQLMKRIRRKFPEIEANCEFIRGGHAAGFQLLEQAHDKIESGEWDCCVIGGIDSFMSLDTIRYLEKTDKLLDSVNQHGFTPGEAAAFFIVGTQEELAKREWDTKALISGFAFTQDPHPLYGDTDCTAKGIIEAVSLSFQQAQIEEKIIRIYSDLNAERERVNEFGYLIPQIRNRIVDTPSIEIPSNKWGELGTATMPALMGLCVASAELGLTEPDHQLILCSSEKEDKGAALIQPLARSDRKEIWQ